MAAQKASPGKHELPEGWVQYTDPDTGDPYYHNAALKQTTWDPPGRWKVGLFFESLREKAEKARLEREKEKRQGEEKSLSRDDKYNWSGYHGEDDVALRRRLSERIEALRTAYAQSEDKGQIGELRDELSRRRERLARLREALEAEKKKAAELVVAAGGEGPSKKGWADDSDSFGPDEEIRSLRLQVADLQGQLEAQQPDETGEDLEAELSAVDETMLDVDAALQDAAGLADAGVDPSLAALLRARPWDDEVIKRAVAEDVVLEWQARDLTAKQPKRSNAQAEEADVFNDEEEEEEEEDEEEETAVVVGVSEEDDAAEQPHQPPPPKKPKDAWVSPLELPGLLLVDVDAKDDDVAVPVALRRADLPLKKQASLGAKFPRTKRFLTGKLSSSLFTDAAASERYESLEAAATLPGTCWQWLCGWRVDGGGDGWLYGDVRALALAYCTSDGLHEGTSYALGGDEVVGRARPTPSKNATVRCRRWRRTRALVQPPPDPSLDKDKPNGSVVCVVARKLLELRAHAASLEVLASKLSDQLVSTRTALDASETKAARLPALEAALVETSSMLRDTELRRDALERQLRESTGVVQSQTDRSLAAVLRDTHHLPSTDAESTNNPFVDHDALADPPIDEPEPRRDNGPPIVVVKVVAKKHHHREASFDHLDDPDDNSDDADPLDAAAAAPVPRLVPRLSLHRVDEQPEESDQERADSDDPQPPPSDKTTDDVEEIVEL